MQEEKNNLEIRKNVHTFAFMKPKEKRFVKGYKIAKSHYSKAMRRAKKEKVPLTLLIETFVALYGNGSGELMIKDRGVLPLKSMAMDFRAGIVPRKLTSKENKNEGTAPPVTRGRNTGTRDPLHFF